MPITAEGRYTEGRESIKAKAPEIITLFQLIPIISFTNGNFFLIRTLNKLYPEVEYVL